MDSGQKRAVLTWHRRAGKDKLAVNLVIKKMLERVGAYYYILPTYAQGKKIIWEGIGKDGFRLLDHFPAELIKRKNDSEMLIELINGSIFRVVGSDNYDSIVGTNPIGCVFSEYALQNPRAWDFLRPILLENGGWAVFVSTPRGHNHFYDIYKTAENQGWFCQKLTVDDTSVISRDQINEERSSGMSEDLIQQEYFCSFEASVQGAYYSDQIKTAKDQNRICAIKHEPDLLVHTAWDLGFDDATAIIFYQLIGKEIRIIDYEEHNGESLMFYATLLQQKGYRYGSHHLPHDAAAKRLDGGGKSIELQLNELGVMGTDIVENVGIDTGIQSVRSLFSRFWIDNSSDRTRHFIECVTQYHKEFDEDRKIYRSKPEHDWTSHCCDALRMLAVAFTEEYIPPEDDIYTEPIYGGRLA